MWGLRSAHGVRRGNDGERPGCDWTVGALMWEESRVEEMAVQSSLKKRYDSRRSWTDVNPNEVAEYSQVLHAGLLTPLRETSPQTHSNDRPPQRSLPRQAHRDHKTTTSSISLTAQIPLFLVDQ